MFNMWGPHTTPLQILLVTRLPWKLIYTFSFLSLNQTCIHLRTYLLSYGCLNFIEWEILLKILIILAKFALSVCILGLSRTASVTVRYDLVFTEAVLTLFMFPLSQFFIIVIIICHLWTLGSVVHCSQDSLSNRLKKWPYVLHSSVLW